MRALPLLRVLSIRVDHPSQRDNPAVPENAGPPSHIIGDEEIPGKAVCTHIYISSGICTVVFGWVEEGNPAVTVLVLYKLPFLKITSG